MSRKYVRLKPLLYHHYRRHWIAAVKVRGDIIITYSIFPKNSTYFNVTYSIFSYVYKNIKLHILRIALYYIILRACNTLIRLCALDPLDLKTWMHPWCSQTRDPINWRHQCKYRISEVMVDLHVTRAIISHFDATQHILISLQYLENWRRFSVRERH